MDYLDLVSQLPRGAWVRAFASLALCLLLVPLTMPFARRFGLVDHPGGRKQHGHATPVTGGLAILLSVITCFLVFDEHLGMPSAIFIGCALALVVVGQLDDLWDIPWTWRIAAQAGAAIAMMVFAGVMATRLQDVFGFVGANMGLFAVPFTIFIVVGVINALNMCDGVDGLAGTLSLVSLSLFTGFALYAGDVVLAERLLTVVAALVGFLFWNLRFPWQPQARVFLGNGGSMLLGFIIAWVAVRGTHDPLHPVSPVLGPWTIALPLIDCVVLMARRARAGRSPFSADRHHMHHMLLDAGFRPTQVVLLLGGISLALGLGAAIAVKMGVYRPLLVVAFLLLLAAWYLFSNDYDRAVARLARWSGHARRVPSAEVP